MLRPSNSKLVGGEFGRTSRDREPPKAYSGARTRVNRGASAAADAAVLSLSTDWKKWKAFVYAFPLRQDEAVMMVAVAVEFLKTKIRASTQFLSWNVESSSRASIMASLNAGRSGTIALAEGVECTFRADCAADHDETRKQGRFALHASAGD